MLIWCVTSEEGRNQVNAYTRKKKHNTTENHERLANTFESTGTQEIIHFNDGLSFSKRVWLLVQIFIQHYLLNLLKLNQIPNCLTQLNMNLFGMIPQAKSLIIVLD